MPSERSNRLNTQLSSHLSTQASSCQGDNFKKNSMYDEKDGWIAKQRQIEQLRAERMIDEERLSVSVSDIKAEF